MNMNLLRTALLALIVLVLVVPASPAHRSDGGKHRGKGHGKSLQQRIALPNGFQPEGIASTGGRDLFVGSIPTGAIWRGDAKTGAGGVLVPPREGRSAIGIKVERGLIFVAGGATGDAYVYDARTGTDVARYDLAAEGANTFVNDVVVTRHAAYFTDSRLAQIYVLPLGRKSALPAQADVRTLPLTGDIAYTTGNNANGIEWTGRWLIVAQTNTGKLFRVDPSTGVADEIELTGGDVMNGDGLLLRDHTLYVVQNRINQIAVVKLAKRYGSGRIGAHLTDPDFAVPTTITIAAGRLFAVNARFGTAPGPDVPYWIARVG
jgi:sugar lactone lactonase YvrE